jgi:hypothetical protein
VKNVLSGSSACGRCLRTLLRGSRFSSGEELSVCSSMCCECATLGGPGGATKPFPSPRRGGLLSLHVIPQSLLKLESSFAATVGSTSRFRMRCLCRIARSGINLGVLPTEQ